MIATTRYYAKRIVHIAITSPVDEQVDPAEVALCGAIVIGYPDTAFDSNCDDCIVKLEALEAAETEALATLTTSKPVVQEWFGRRARYTVIKRKGSKSLSERVAITEWIDDARSDNGGHKAGTVVVRHMTGDGRFPSKFTLHNVEVMAGDNAVERATRWAHDALLGRQGRDHALRTMGIDCEPAGC